MNARSRNSAIELLRILSMLIIVGCHFATYGGFSFSASDLSPARFLYGFLGAGRQSRNRYFCLDIGLLSDRERFVFDTARKSLSPLGADLFLVTPVVCRLVSLGRGRPFGKEHFADAFPRDLFAPVVRKHLFCSVSSAPVSQPFSACALRKGLPPLSFGRFGHVLRPSHSYGVFLRWKRAYRVYRSVRACGLY